MSQAPAEKELLRQSFRLKRRQISVARQEEKAKQIANLLTSFPEFLSSKQIAGYWPIDGEISPLSILEQAHIEQKHCYLPVITGSSKHLQFVEYKPNDPLIPNQFGILEPDPSTQKTISIADLDLILIPLVAFDRQGHRLGMGEGYYDQTFSTISEQHKTKKPFLLGLAYEIQHVETLPLNDWDVPLHGILTEKNYFPI